MLVGSLCEVVTIYSTLTGEFTACLFFLTFLKGVFLSHFLHCVFSKAYNFMFLCLCNEMAGEGRDDQKANGLNLLGCIRCLQGVMVVDGLNY